MARKRILPSPHSFDPNRSVSGGDHRGHLSF